MMSDDDMKREWLARSIYGANPRGVWNNRVEPMIFEPYSWDELDPQDEIPAYLGMADRVLADINREGWLLVPPNHIPFPRTREEAEVMNVISERFLCAIR